MSAVNEADAHKCRFRAENLRIDLVEHFPADIVVAIAGRSGKAGVGYLVILKRLHDLERVLLRNSVNALELRPYLIFRFLRKCEHLRLHITEFHIKAPLLSA